MTQGNEDDYAMAHDSGVSAASIASPSKSAMDPRATIVLIGFRGVSTSHHRSSYSVGGDVH